MWSGALRRATGRPRASPLRSSSAHLLGREEEYSRAASDPAPKIRRRRAERGPVEAQKDLAGHGAPALERVTGCETPAAADGASRTARVKNSEGWPVSCSATWASLTLIDAAHRRLIETTPSDRQVHRELSEDELRTSRADAEDRQALAEAEAQRQQLHLTKAADEIDGRRRTAPSGEVLLDVLGVLVNAPLALSGRMWQRLVTSRHSPAAMRRPKGLDRGSVDGAAPSPRCLREDREPPQSCRGRSTCLRGERGLRGIRVTDVYPWSSAKWPTWPAGPPSWRRRTSRGRRCRAATSTRSRPTRRLW